ncbi:MAG: heptaprenylglycerol acetyltransferase [Thermoplasmata archaeon]|jgi:maltose O-acetyltransferase|nr:heptaprenylglycerol acetyltransferase [Thermoplasmata archaeon]
MPHPRVEVRPSRGPRNSLHYFGRDVSRWRVAWNYLWLAGSKTVPWFALKNWMVRRSGAKVGRHVSLGLSAQLDVLFPGRITIGDDAIVGYNTTILCHGYTHGSYQLGDVAIGARASIGANCTILPGVAVGEDAVVGAGSVVLRDVPPGEFWAGVPAKRVRAKF